MSYLDMETLYYSKRKKGKDRKYFKTLDELYISEQRTELIEKKILASWVGIYNNSILKLN